MMRVKMNMKVCIICNRFCGIARTSIIKICFSFDSDVVLSICCVMTWLHSWWYSTAQQSKVRHGTGFSISHLTNNNIRAKRNCTTNSGCVYVKSTYFEARFLIARLWNISTWQIHRSPFRKCELSTILASWWDPLVSGKHWSQFSCHTHFEERKRASSLHVCDMKND